MLGVNDAEAVRRVNRQQELLGHLLDVSYGLPPWRVAAAIAEHAAWFDGSDAVIYLQDYGQQMLMPLPYEGSPDSGPEQIEGTLPGRAFVSSSTIEWPTDGGVRLYLPLLDGADRVGVLAFTVPSLDDALRKLATRFASAVAGMIVIKGALTDEFFRARRLRSMALAAEMQWQLLPPLTMRDPRVHLAGLLEPAYEVGGDAFDYAINHSTAHVAIFDAMGHGLGASTMAVVAVSAYRHARRQGVELADKYAEVDAAVASQFGEDHFVTLQMANLHLASGVINWVNAGHPSPMLFRGHKFVRVLGGETTLPAGFGGGMPAVNEEQLQPNDRLLFYSDGVIEARVGGDLFGEQRLIESTERELSAELPAAETARRLSHSLLKQRSGDTLDDATLVLVEWAGRTLD